MDHYIWEEGKLVQLRNGGPSMHWTRFHYTGQKIEKGARGGDAKSSLFAPVYMSEYVPSILQTEYQCLIWRNQKNEYVFDDWFKKEWIHFQLSIGEQSVFSVHF